MNQTQLHFLHILKEALINQKYNLTLDDFSSTQLSDLFYLSEKHHVLPLIYEVIYDSPVAQSEPQLFAAMKQKVIHQVMMQTMRTMEFESLYRKLNLQGIYPLVVKGLICRNLYPNPDHRISGDEDVLIPLEQFELCHKVMMHNGMMVVDESQNMQEMYEVPYGKKGSPLYIELHKYLFPPKSEAYGNLNDYFERVHENFVVEKIDGVEIRTMNPTDHLFYLICHSFKHFLHSGFGIRQVCDIIMFANRYGAEIDWLRILEHCKEIHGEYFTAALFRIGEKYLTFDPMKACYPEQWKSLEVDEEMMLEELLDSGVFGDSSMSRKHSSNITLDAVSAQKQGKKGSYGILKSLFPSMEYMKTRYKYVKKVPLLLPIGWIHRILDYSKEASRNKATNNVAEAMKIGSERIELMKQYKILK